MTLGGRALEAVLTPGKRDDSPAHRSSPQKNPWFPGWQDRTWPPTVLSFFRCFRLTASGQQNHGHGDDGDERSSPQQSHEHLPQSLQAGQMSVQLGRAVWPPSGWESPAWAAPGARAGLGAFGVR